jgi:hypothetical protein
MLFSLNANNEEGVILPASRRDWVCLLLERLLQGLQGHGKMRKPTLYQSLKAKRRSQQMVIGVTWYTEASWAEVKATATDPACFEESFEKWKAMAVAARRNFQRSGVMALECLIDPETFFAWCAANNQENNSTSRGEFVSEVLSAAHNKPG